MYSSKREREREKVRGRKREAGRVRGEGWKAWLVG
jgi:hypothetical protein